jgi:hypothetical protein
MLPRAKKSVRIGDSDYWPKAHLLAQGNNSGDALLFRISVLGSAQGHIFDPLRTPRSSRQLRQAIAHLSMHLNPSRDIRLLLQKTAKGFEELQVARASDSLVLEGQKSKINSLLGKRARQRVSVDPNTQFASIEEIKTALDRAAALRAQWEARGPVNEAKTTSRQIQMSDVSKFCFEFQIGDI